jgi:hypothetical protein
MLWKQAKPVQRPGLIEQAEASFRAARVGSTLRAYSTTGNSPASGRSDTVRFLAGFARLHHLISVAATYCLAAKRDQYPIPLVLRQSVGPQVPGQPTCLKTMQPFSHPNHSLFPSR